MIPDWLLLIINWVHHLGAVTWVGGNIFYKFVLQPAFRTPGSDPGTVRSIGREFGRVVPVAIIILATTGAIMAATHLTTGGNSPEYIGILALKIAIALYMFLVALLLRRRAKGGGPSRSEASVPRLRRALTSTTTLLILGVVVIGLADVLGSMGGHSAGGHGEATPTDGHHESDDAGAGAGAGEDNGDDHHNGDQH